MCDACQALPAGVCYLEPVGMLSWLSICICQACDDSQSVQVLILCPDSDDSETLKGQLLEVEVASLRDTISSLKVRPPCCHLSPHGICSSHVTAASTCLR